ncbi:uncharacterized protein LOC111337428 isoform X2 [Stylophora pistillata]|uniref:uncharacterized protein LOC111337428 isoform X2 n=1 Tax=Stylophora pistillata TaxID=50429 RepID=UPI000C051E08|nr:uncharacterized protein LOC111337428 isoform X2 [Stylophora pistillata]
MLQTVLTWKQVAVKIQIPSMDLELMLIYEIASIDVQGKSDGYDRPKLSKVFKCKKIPQYLGNTTCFDYDAFETTNPGLISRMWNFTVTVMTHVQDVAVDLTSGMWKKCIVVLKALTRKVSNGLGYVWIGMVNWTRGKVAWFSDLTWNGAEWLGKLLWNCAGLIWNGLYWLADLIWNGLKWLVDFAITASYSLSDMVQNKAAELAKMMVYGVMLIVELFVPVVHYITDFVVEFYFGFLHEHVKHIQARFDFVSWQDGVYAVFAGLVVNVALLVAGFLAYRLCVRTVKFIGRKWQEYKDRRAAANMPPKSNKPIWQPKRKHKKKKRIDDW